MRSRFPCEVCESIPNPSSFVMDLWAVVNATFSLLAIALIVQYGVKAKFFTISWAIPGAWPPNLACHSVINWLIRSILESTSKP